MSEVLSYVCRSRFVDVEREWGGTWINEKGSLPHKLQCNFKHLRDRLQVYHVYTANNIVSPCQYPLPLSFFSQTSCYFNDYSSFHWQTCKSFSGIKRSWMYALSLIKTL